MFFHLNSSIISRATGRSATAAAAYRSGSLLKSVYDGNIYDYSPKAWVIHSEIVLPKYAPKELEDRQKLYDAIELVEKSSKAQTCREIEVAIPKEATLEEANEMVRKFINENFTSIGIVADFSIHFPPERNDFGQPIDSSGKPTNEKEQMVFKNLHAHILLSMRPIDKTGKWAAKTQKEYICVNTAGQERKLTADELKSLDGWEKQFKYLNPKTKETIWTSKVDGDENGWLLISNEPKSTRYGRKNSVLEKMNSKDAIREWRKSWEDIINEFFITKGLDERVDSRSYAERNIDLIPTKHRGPYATKLMRREEREIRENLIVSEKSEIASINKKIKRENSIIKKIGKKIDSAIETTVELIEGIRVKMISNEYHHSYFKDEKYGLERIVSRDLSRIDAAEQLYRKYVDVEEKMSSKIRLLKQKLKEESGLKGRKRKEIEAEIIAINRKVSERKKALQSRIEAMGFSGLEDLRARRVLLDSIIKRIAELSTEDDFLQNKMNGLLKIYEKNKRVLDESEYTDEKVSVIREKFEELLVLELKTYHKKIFEGERYERAKKSVDARLSGENLRPNRSINKGR